MAATAASLNFPCSKLAGCDSPTLGFCTRGIVAGVEVITEGLMMGLSMLESWLGVAGRQKGGGTDPLKRKFINIDYTSEVLPDWSCLIF